MYRGEDEVNERWIAGPWWSLSLTPKFFILSEVDFQEKKLKAFSTEQRGYVMSHRFGYELAQGLIPFLSFEKKYLDRNDSSSQHDLYGLGLQWFPRPHWEVEGGWQKDRLIQTNQYVDLIWLMLHFYL